ncbi:hypothetical protein Misp01_35150 [Microtetraspora sp. NBRC 13810]|uniref:single-stranded DNA-binding protein n=1 Tax=Microtetraspora sp. NBRC 13810 TaxID=3030990 RepID=UPI00249FDCD4|nr:single-stranded DNA-binding protein [Microtetraspora sp. NBRC 13810]GLW08385.1 hypothetical protein Misp01_35150 [Microtetraspora sp. NBRC 13810]
MDRNEVTLVGRMSAAAEDRSRAGGTTLTTWRLIVRRRAAVVDVIDCVTFDPELAAAVARRRPGDVIEVTGALRRRFFNTGQGKVSTYSVEAAGVRVVDRPAETGP